MSLIGTILAGGVSTIVDSAAGLARVFVKDKTEGQQLDAAQQASVSEQFSAEFNDRRNRTWWDSLIDGVNRLPRPVIAFSVIAMMFWPVIDPIEFSIVMQAYSIVPAWVAGLFIQVVALFFGGKFLTDMKFGGVPKQKVVEMMEAVKELRGLKLQSEKPIISEDEFEGEMANEATPLSNPAIEEWNRRRKRV